MAFYLEPPNGNISLQKLEKFAIRRLNFLIQISELESDHIGMRDILTDSCNVAESECLIEGTVKDRVSHFILRLACSEDKIIAAFFLRAETALFHFRFASMSRLELNRFFVKLDTYLTKFGDCAGFPEQNVLIESLKPLQFVKKVSRTWNTATQWYLEGSCTRFFNVPFQTVLHLVAKRTVTLQKGMAAVPFCKLHELLGNIFTMTLNIGLEKADEQRVNVLQDERMQILFKKVLAVFKQRFKYRNDNGRMAPLSLHLLDVESRLFPPCMSHLHTTLRDNHRLRHHARIQYTLFLKAAGLPLHEALVFWRNEYSKDATSKDGCVHTWQEHEGRYTYNIRHLYGLEGSRINYRAHCCQSLQTVDGGSQWFGGCFFKNCDSKHLRVLLRKIGKEDCFDKIHQLCQDTHYSAACKLYSHLMLESIKDQMSETSCNHKTVNSGLEKEISAVFHHSDSEHEWQILRKRKRKIIDLDDDCDEIETVNCRWKKEYTNCNKWDQTLSRSIADPKDETDPNRVLESCSISSNQECSTSSTSKCDVNRVVNNECEFPSTNSEGNFKNPESQVGANDNGVKENLSNAEQSSHRKHITNTLTTGGEKLLSRKNRICSTNLSLCSGKEFLEISHRDCSDEGVSMIEKSKDSISSTSDDTCIGKKSKKNILIGSSGLELDINTCFETEVNTSIQECDPQVCPSQCRHRDRTTMCIVDSSTFLKPVDFYYSMKKLIQGMKNLN
ncbi:hypothetical protein ScPMuIL_017011 [Solemya velum]